MLGQKVIIASAAACIAAGLVFASPAQAASFKVIKWNTTRICQVYDFGWGTKPIPSDYTVLTKPLLSFAAAQSAEQRLWKKGKC
jgi:hypothetical protein